MTIRQRLAVAAVLSAGLHALLVSGGWWQLAPRPAGHPPLEVRLEPAPPPAMAPAPAVRPKSRRHARNEPAREARQGRKPADSDNFPAFRLAPAQREPDPAAESGETAATGEDRPAEVGDAPASTNGTETAVEAPAAGRLEQQEQGAKLPKHGTIRYALTFGRDGFNVGRAVQTWEVADGRYMLASEAETTGLIELFRPQRLRWLSKGSVTRGGLRPDSFLVSRTRRGQTEAASARFDWGAGNLTFGPATERAVAGMPAGAQDIMSFIYQLSLSPPQPGRFSMPITTGTRFEVFEIEVRNEEEIDTPLGAIRALPVRQQPRPGAESIEIWLAPEYRYLPVRIRYFDREGNPAGEQVASEISVSED